MRKGLVAAGTAVVLLCPVWASAQDMVFAPEEEEGSRPDAAAGALPTEAMAQALRHYQQGAYREAAVGFDRVASGQTGDGAESVERAQFYLACSLFHLGFFQTSLAVFEDIVEQGRAQSHFEPTLPWLVQLSRRLPEPAAVTSLLNHYGDSLDLVRRFDTGETRAARGDLPYLMGRSWYDRGEMAAARRFLLEVPPESPHYYESRFFAAVSHVRERHAAPAARILRQVQDELAGRLFPSPRERRLRDLASLSLARIYYSTRHWDAALEAWSRIPPTSEHWTDALFEQAFAHFQVDGFGRALGNVHSLDSPYLETSSQPEALVLRAVIYFGRCQYELADQAVTAFQERYQPVRDELAALAPGEEDGEAWAAIVDRVRQERAELSPRAARVARDAMADRTLLRQVAYISALEEEARRLEAMPPAFASSSVGTRVLQEVTLARAAARDGVGRLGRSRYERLVGELQDLLNQATAISIEILAERRRVVQEGDPRRARATPEVAGDAEHILWPFEGEYWRDELGAYEQPVADLCGR